METNIKIAAAAIGGLVLGAGLSGGDCRKWPRHHIIQQTRQKAPINFRRPPQRGPRSVTKSHPIDGQRCEARSQVLLQRPHLSSS